MSTLFRVWQADGRGELVRACRPQPSMLLDRRIWKQPHQQCKYIKYQKIDDIIANLHLKNSLQSVLSFSFGLHVYANSNSFFNKHFNESYWLNIIKMFSWNVSGNPMEQYFTEWESGYPKNRCPTSPAPPPLRSVQQKNAFCLLPLLLFVWLSFCTQDLWALGIAV